MQLHIDKLTTSPGFLVIGCESMDLVNNMDEDSRSLDNLLRIVQYHY